MFNIFKNNSHHLAWNHGFSSSNCLKMFQSNADSSKFTKDMIYFGAFMDVMKQEVCCVSFYSDSIGTTQTDFVGNLFSRGLESTGPNSGWNQLHSWGFSGKYIR
jgi:hypothetical protein